MNIALLSLSLFAAQLFPPPVQSSTPTPGIVIVTCKHPGFRHPVCVTRAKHPGLRGPIPPVKAHA